MCTTQAGINTYIFIACSITFLIMALLRLFLDCEVSSVECVKIE